MKHILYVTPLALFAVVVFFSPSRTTTYSFPYTPSEVRKSDDRVVSPVEAPAKKKVVMRAPAPPLPIAEPAPTPTLIPVLATEAPIDLRSAVVVKCVFRGAGGNSVTAYGSGVIVASEGYVLTARHVVDMAYTHRITGGKQGLTDYSLEWCRIAVPPDGVKTPTAAEIRAINPFTPVTEFAYDAQVVFVPPLPASGGMSEAEYDFADSALLRITSAVSGGLPSSFIASPMKIFQLPVQGEAVMSFGFPSGSPSYGNNFYLQGNVGVIDAAVGGDSFFKNQPMGLTATMETIGGRSGSPVFWNGYVIGVVSSKGDYSRTAAISGIFPLARFAEEAGIAVFK